MNSKVSKTYKKQTSDSTAMKGGVGNYQATSNPTNAGGMQYRHSMSSENMTKLEESKKGAKDNKGSNQVKGDKKKIKKKSSKPTQGTEDE